MYTISLTSSCLHSSDIGGLEESIRLCRTYNAPRLLAAVSTIIVAMVPKPSELLVSAQYATMSYTVAFTMLFRDFSFDCIAYHK